MATFVLKTAKDQSIYFRLVAANGQTILSSEMYATKAAALNGVESVKKNAPLDERYERKTNARGEPMFNLKAANHQVIGTSEGYSSASARESGIASVKSGAPFARIDDQT
jgi:uncharacterized protein YegP (UPF0339 family)